MVKQSAGILVYRWNKDSVEVLLAHPGGPFWGHKDTWSIPKGEMDEGEDLMSAAKREFKEETGFEPPSGQFQDLGQSKQGSSKINCVWATEGDVDVNQFVCTSTFTMEWPPRSGQQHSFPENDRIKWFGLSEARQKLFKAQTVFINRLAGELHVVLPETKSEPPKNSTPQQSALF